MSINQLQLQVRTTSVNKFLGTLYNSWIEIRWIDRFSYESELTLRQSSNPEFDFQTCRSYSHVITAFLQKSQVKFVTILQLWWFLGIQIHFWWKYQSWYRVRREKWYNYRNSYHLEYEPQCNIIQCIIQNHTQELSKKGWNVLLL